MTVTQDDLARAMLNNTVARLFGKPRSRKPRQERRLLESGLLRVRAVLMRDQAGSLAGHRIMDAHSGSARRNLSEDVGIAIAMSFAEKILLCRQHYILDAVANARRFGIPLGKRPDIASVTATGSTILTEAKGTMREAGLASRAGCSGSAKLVRNSYQQLTGEEQAQPPSGTRLFLAATSCISGGQSLRLDTAEYLASPAQPCSQCANETLGGDAATPETDPPPPGEGWNALAAEFFSHTANLVGTRAESEELDGYRVRRLAGADVTIGLHHSIHAAAENPDANHGEQLTALLDDLPDGTVDPDDGRYADGTLVRANWPDMESDNQDDADGTQ